MIDDGSPDGTLEVAKKLQEIYGEDRIVSLFLQRKTGIWSANRKYLLGNVNI